MNNFAYLNGVYNITPTPFHPDGTLDEASIQAQIAARAAAKQ